MLLKQFLDVANDVQPEEFRPFAELTQQYVEAREAGKRGLVQSDVLMEQVEHLLQLFQYHEPSGTYVHDGLDKAIPVVNPKTGEAVVALFETFWSLFPRKEAKAGALRSWKAQVKTLEAANKAIAALPVHTRHHGWDNQDRRYTKEGRDTCPMATTWINQHRWNDELVAPKPRRGSYAPMMPADAMVGVR